jgi:hypothetical protein
MIQYASWEDQLKGVVRSISVDRSAWVVAKSLWARNHAHNKLSNCRPSPSLTLLKMQDLSTNGLLG